MAASIRKTIEILFAGVDQVSNVVNDIGGNMDNLGNNLQDFAAPFETGLNSLLAFDAALIALAATGLKVANDFDEHSKRMANSLGLPTEEAKKFEEIARDVYTQGYGDTLAESFDAVTLAQKKFADSAETDIGGVVTKAFELQNVFGVEYSNSLGAASTLMKNFGITADEAFDFIAKGYQIGLDGSGDFIESINEYATQFANGGADAGEFFSVLETGFQEGMLGTDRAADAFKEFRVRIVDGSKTTAEALALLGLDENFTKSISEGKLTAIDAFNIIIEKLKQTDDESILMQAGVGLIGTQFEDLGTKSALALDSTKTKMEDIQGTMNDFDTDTLTKNLSAAWRTAIDAIGNLPIWDELSDKIEADAEAISENFAQVIGETDLSELKQKAQELWDEISNIFESSGLDLTTVEGVKEAVELSVDSIISLLDVTKGVAEVAGPPIELLIGAIKDFNALSPETKELAGNVLAIGAAFGTLGGILAVGGPVLSGLSGIAAALTGPVGITFALTGAALAAIKFGADFVSGFKPVTDELPKVSDLVEEFKYDIEHFPTDIKTELELAIKRGAEADEVMEIIREGVEAIDVDMLVTADGLGKVKSDIDSIPEKKTTEIYIDGELSTLDEIEDRIDDLTATDWVDIKVDVEIAEDSVEKATETLEYWVDGVRYTIEVPVEATEVEKVKKDIDSLPKEKELEIRLKGQIDKDIAAIEAQASVLQSAFQYKAEVDIAEIEAQAEIIQAIFESVDTAIQSTGDTILGALDKIDSEDFRTKWRADEVLREEREYRKESFELQKKLTEEQIKALQAKTEAIKDGMELKIDTSGTDPALELFVIELLKKVQVWANENFSNFLMGME